jgi:hypothetical protein
MFRKYFLIYSAFLFVLLFGAVVFGQADASTPNGRPQQKEELPKNIRETLAKQRIEQEKKEYDELVKRSEEAVRLSEELDKSFTASNQLSGEDQKKLERLEKLVKKIRSELGGDDEEEKPEIEEKPSSVGSALKALQTNAVKLFDEIKKSTRYSVSAIAIQSSNLLLKVLKFIRFRN